MEKNVSALDRWLRPLGASAIVTLGLLLVLLSFWMREANPEQGAFVNRLLFSSSFVENWFHDLRSRRFLSETPSPNLVVLEITDQSLAKIGRWPWTRTKHAKILDNLRAYGARTVMFDVFFPEAEGAAPDAALAASLTKFGEGEGRTVVLGYGLTADPAEALSAPDELQLSALTGSAGAENMPHPQFVDQLAFNTPALRLFDARYGFIVAKADPDGVFRHAQILNWQEGSLYPSLGLAAYIGQLAGAAGHQVSAEALPAGQGYSLKIKEGTHERSILLSAHGELKVRYHGGETGFTRLGIERVFLDEAPAANEELKSLFAGKAVLIGSSALGAHDLRHTPVDPQLPGMYVHANLFHALDQHYFYRADDASLFFSLGLFAFGTVGVLLLARRRNPLVETLGALALLAAAYAADHLWLNPEGYFIRLFFVLFNIVALYAWFTVLNVFQEGREKKKIRDAFSRYVAPEIVKEMLNNPEKLRVGGEKKEITMLFSDVRDFTTISERLSAADLAALLNVYMGRMTDILFETGGTLDKYIGDAMVGFWGAPLDLPDHAYHAVRGAKEMLEALPAVNEEFARRKFPKVNVGIGLNTGEVSVGNMGSDKIFQYTALGDSMNLASRLESLTKHYGVNLMISEFTHAKLGARAAEFRLRPLDLVQVKGKSKAVKIYEVIPDWSPWAKQPELLQRVTFAYEELYLKRKFAEAAEEFRAVLATLPDDKNTKYLAEQTAAFLAAPPPAEWDGVTIFTTK